MKKIPSGTVLSYGFSGFIKVWKLDKAYVLISLLVSAIAASDQIFYIFYWKNILLAITNHSSTGTILFWCGLMAAFEFLMNVSKSLYDTIFSPVHKDKITTKLKIEIYQKIVSTDFIKYSDPDFQNDFLYAQDKYIQGLLKIVESASQLITSCISILVLSYIVFQMGIVVAILIVLFVGLSIYFNSLVQKLTYKRDVRKNVNDRQISFVFRAFNSLEYGLDIKCFGYSKILFKNLKKAIKSNRDIQLQSGKKLSFFTLASSSLIGVFEVCLIVILSFFSSKGKMDVGKFSLTINSIFKMAFCLWDIFKILPDLYGIGLIIHKFESYKKEESLIETTGSLMPGLPISCIEIRHLYFRYSPEQDYVLKDINLTFKQGETVAIIGQNGSGKSTLIKILLKFLKPTQGNVFYNSMDYLTIRTCFFRENVGCCMQRNHLFPFTIREFILGMRQNELSAEKEQLLLDESCDFSGFSSIIQKYKLTYDSFLTKEFEYKGVELSGGEKQKLFLARAYASKSNVIVFDEPSAALDPPSECDFFQKLNQLKPDHVIIYITHNLKYTRYADKIVSIADGHIDERGNHQQLVADNLHNGCV